MLRDATKTIGNMIDKQSVVMISSIDPDGFPTTKAMLAPRIREGIHTFYFTTNTSSQRVQHYLVSPKACLYFYDKRFFRGVMLKGEMEVLVDSESKKMMWREGDVQYYSKGVNDPDYCVLKFTALSGRYYANYASQDFEIESHQ